MSVTKKFSTFGPFSSPVSGFVCFGVSPLSAARADVYKAVERSRGAKPVSASGCRIRQYTVGILYNFKKYKFFTTPNPLIYMNTQFWHDYCI